MFIIFFRKWFFVILIVLIFALSGIYLIFRNKYIPVPTPVPIDIDSICFNSTFREKVYNVGCSFAIDKDGIIWVALSTAKVASDIQIPADKTKLGDLCLLGIDPEKKEGEQIVYNRCFVDSFFPIMNETNYSLAIDKDGIIWLAGEKYTLLTLGGERSDNKLWILGIDPKKKESEQVVYNRCFADYVFDCISPSITTGKDGKIWVSVTTLKKLTPDKEGISFGRPANQSDILLLGIDPKKQESEQIVYHRRLGSSRDEMALAIAIDTDGNLWVLGRLSDYNEGDFDVPVSKNGERIWLFAIAPDKSEDKQIVYNHRFGGYRSIVSITVGKDGVIWVLNSGLNARNISLTGIKNKRVVYDQIFEGNFNLYSVSLTVDTDGIIWIATQPDLRNRRNYSYARYEVLLLGIDSKKKKDEQIVYNRSYERKNFISNLDNFYGDKMSFQTVYSMLISANGTLWMLGASSDGSEDSCIRDDSPKRNLWLLGVKTP